MEHHGSKPPLPPWQYEWQRPQWQVAQDCLEIAEPVAETKTATTQPKNVEGTCLGMTSARVTFHELPDLLSEQEEEQGSLILTATVVSSPFCVLPENGTTTNTSNSSNSEIPPSGDLLVLEILKYPGPISDQYQENADEAKELSLEEKNPQESALPQRIITKSLRWPGFALQDNLPQGNQKEAMKKGKKKWRQNLLPWLGGQKATDAASSSSSFGGDQVGIVAACLCRKRIETDKQKAQAADALDTMRLLSLGLDPEMIRNNQKESAGAAVKIDEPMNIDDAGHQPTTITPEIVLVCLCSDGTIHVYSPWKLLQLPKQKPEKEKQQEQEDIFANSMSSFLMGEYVFAQLQSNILPLSQPEVTVKLSIQLQKIGHEVSKSEYELQGGSNYTKQNVDTEQTEGVSFWDRSVWDPNVDPFTAMYRTRNNVPTHCISAFEYVVVAGRGKRLKRSGGSINSGGSPIKDGGFITLLSLRHYSEVRTLFLPFIPLRVSPFVWGGMQFLFVIGENEVAVAIRIDISIHNTVVCGEPPKVKATGNDIINGPLIPTVSSDQSLLSYQSSNSRATDRTRRKPCCCIYRFQILPIVLPKISVGDNIIDTTQVFNSQPFTSPPGLVTVKSRSQQDALVFRHTLQSVDYFKPTFSSLTERLFRGYKRSRDRRMLAIATINEPRHVATIRSTSEHLSSPEPRVSLHSEISHHSWCHLDQGWCLLGIANRSYFVCWDGATTAGGAFVYEMGNFEIGSTEDAAQSLPCDILPVDPYLAEAIVVNYFRDSNLLEDVNLPFSKDVSKRNSSMRRVMVEATNQAFDNVSYTIDREHNVDDVVKDAIRSISLVDYNDHSMSQNESSTKSRASQYSHHEKSVRLLRRCPVWSHLDDTKDHQYLLEGQVPSVIVRWKKKYGSPWVLAVRRTFAENGVASPFQQILSWLSQRQDYFTAASVALDLLRDAGTLRFLWRSFERIDEDDERTKLEGLLDGIMTVYDNVSGRVDRVGDDDIILQTTLTQLADMTIGCLIRGGFAMSSTLEYFLHQDCHYDSSRACLVLAATIARAVSDEEDALVTVMGKDYERPTDKELAIQEGLWPVRCLLQVGVARNVLPAALALINATASDELRRRSQLRHTNPMQLCTALIKLIISSSPDTTGLLLDLVDEQERKRFWYSLDQETQRELSLIQIDGKCPLLRQLEVRVWAVQYLKMHIEDFTTGDGRSQGEAPTGWLRSICMACLVNAECQVHNLEGSSGIEAALTDDGLAEHRIELVTTREALEPGPYSGGLDFNIVIPALLLLQLRNETWNDKSWVSTQAIIDAACNMAGRASIEEPVFAFDGKVLMQQCYLAENISAGANLVGGKNGLILECCSILIDNCGMTMDQAERFLQADSLISNTRDGHRSETQKVSEDFALSLGHRHVLWLLDQHVLQVSTYGEFDDKPVRGKVDPVFAARTCLRTWYQLTFGHLPIASAWLATWLRQQLRIGDNSISTKRLACAALTRVLLWSNGSDEGEVLAEQIQLESRFLVQLSQACWSLVESIPPAIADELLAQDAVDSQGLKRASTSDSYI